MLDNLGKRICIIGPSNSGKSTLALKLGRLLDFPVCHLDQIAHKPHSDWVRVPNEDFILAHDAIISGGRWIVDGNYSISMPQRFERADSVIWIDPSLWGCMARYVVRSVCEGPDRAGALDGAKKEFGFGLIKFTFFTYPKNRKKYEEILLRYPHLQIYRFNHLVNVERDLT